MSETEQDTTSGSPRRGIMEAEPPKAKPAKYDPNALSFLEHLEELRWRIIKGALGILVGVIVAFFFADFLISHVLLGPTRADFFVYKWLGVDAVNLTLQSRKLPGQFFTYMGVIIVCGVIIGAPIFFYQIYKFLAPALESAQKWRTRWIVFFISMLFFTGVSFGYMVLTPFAVQFFTQFQISDLVRNDFDINEYFSSLALWVMVSGVVFQLPMISYALSIIGLLTPEFLIKYRRHAILGAFIVGAFITPPDPISQSLMAIPLLILYEVGIHISRYAVKKREKEIWGKDGKPKEYA